MGARGPAPTPKRELAARGSWRADDRPDELELPPAKIDPPEGMDDEARAQWQHVVSLLEPKGAITEGDRMALTMLCELWSEDRQLASVLGEQESGSIEWKRVRNARTETRKQLKDMLTKFGLTPADRTRVKTATKEPKAKDGEQFKPKLVG